MTQFNPDTDLQLDKRIAAPPETVWRCWTDPALFARWFAPEPVRITDVDYDFRPGGQASLTMILPDGTAMPLSGCILEVEPARRLVTTDALHAGYRPAASPFMTAIYEFEPDGGGTHLRATVLHPDEAARVKHEEMGFFDGWGTTFGQLADLAASLEEEPI